MLSRITSWPELHIADSRDTYATLQLYAHIVGKNRLALTPKMNQWWNVTLHVPPRGLTTSAMPYGERTLSIDFDFIDHPCLCSMQASGCGASVSARYRIAFAMVGVHLVAEGPKAAAARGPLRRAGGTDRARRLRGHMGRGQVATLPRPGVGDTADEDHHEHSPDKTAVAVEHQGFNPHAGYGLPRCERARAIRLSRRLKPLGVSAGELAGPGTRVASTGGSGGRA
jgi:hypothetical protein